MKEKRKRSRPSEGEHAYSGDQILRETDDLMEEINETWGRNRNTGTQENEEPIERQPR